MDELRIGENRREVLAFLSQKILEVWEGFDQARDSEPEITPFIEKILSEELPRFGTEITNSISQTMEILDRSIAQSRPRFLAYIGSSGLEVGAIADFLASSYDVNQAVDTKAATLLEEQCVRWLAQFIGYPFAFGFFTSGGMVSNLTALAAARRAALPNSRKEGLGKDAVIYCSKESHYSNIRAAEILGFGSDSLRLIDIDECHRMRSNELELAIERDLANGITPVAIIATAGTTLTGAIDPIGEIARIAKRYGVWLHIDGAYGIPAAGTEKASLFNGIEHADSITVDAHKWLFVPKSCSILLVRNLELLSNAFSHQEAYMPHENEKLNPVDFTLEYSRPLRALKLWLAFKTHGADAFKLAIERNIDLANLTYKIANERPDFRVLPNAPALSVVPLQYAPPGCSDVSELNAVLCRKLIADGRFYISPAQIDGETWLRPCFTNFRTTEDDVHALFQVILELGNII